MGGVVRAIASVGLIVLGVVTGRPEAIIAGVGGLVGAVSGGGGGAAKPTAQAGRLSASIDPGTPRKMLFGTTAMATDVRYQAFTGTDQEYYHQIVCCASHKVTSIDELWLDQEIAWSTAGGVATKFSGYLTVVAVLEGSAANAVNIDGNWNAANGCRLTGCAYLHIRYKRTGATKDSDSPFASSITTRMTIRGKGIPVYDARFDSTRGGSGTMRADDQTTWGFTYGATEIGRNPAAQIGTFMLGWKIGGKLAVGCGMPANRIDWSRMITAANVSDESVTLAAGGTEPRYRTDLLTGEGDDRGTAFGMWKESCNALLRDAGGKIAFDVLVNDLSSPVLRLTDDDVLSEGTWLQSTSLPEYRNIVRGRYTDARDSALYQLVDWPQISLTAPDGIDRILALDLPAVQSVSQAQRIAKQKLQRLQAGGRADGFTFGQRAWAAQVGDCVWWTFSALGFVDKPFRVESLKITPDGRVPMALTEEKTAFYSWSAEDSAPVTLPTPTTYNWQNEPLVSQLGTIETGADVTATAQVVVTAPPLAEVLCDYLGTPSTDELPRRISVSVSRGGTSIKTDTGTTYAATFTNLTATIDNTGGSSTKGDFTVTAMSANEGYADVVATVGAVAQPVVRTILRKVFAAPPSTGGSGSKTASDSILTAITTTSYVQISDTLTVTLAASERLVGSGSLDYYVSGTTVATRTATVKWGYRTALSGGAFTDFPTPATGSSAGSGKYVGGEWIEATPGHVDANDAKTGLSAGDYEVALFALASATGRSISWDGTARIEAKP